MKPIFVFGSNLAGRHGKGAALAALKNHGAVYGIGQGPQGSSYAIPTKGKSMQTLSLTEIKAHVDEFIHYALFHPSETFEITAIGCGLAGYSPADIAPLFKQAPKNCILPLVFKPFINHDSY